MVKDALRTSVSNNYVPIKWGRTGCPSCINESRHSIVRSMKLDKPNLPQRD